jgi:hypothetical protein
VAAPYGAANRPEAPRTAVRVAAVNLSLRTAAAWWLLPDIRREEPPTVHHYRRSCSPSVVTAQAPRRRSRWLLACAIALAVAFTPAVDLVDDAWAKGGNGNGGSNGGGGNSGGNGGGGNSGNSGGGNGAGRGGEGGGFAGGHGRGGVEKAERSQERGGPSADVGTMIGSLRDAFNPGAAKREARERYAAAAGWSGQSSSTGRGRGFGRPSHEVDNATTASLVALGWEAPEAVADTGFRNHGHRVSSMVEIAKALGYGAHVGALQANFGTAAAPTTEDGDAVTHERLSAEIGQLEAALAAVEDPEGEEAAAMRERLGDLESELAGLDAETPEWNGDWRTANLDITGDGVVDLADLDAARQLGSTPAGDQGEGVAPDDALADNVPEEETLAEDAPAVATTLADDGVEVVGAGG